MFHVKHRENMFLFIVTFYVVLFYIGAIIFGIDNKLLEKFFLIVYSMVMVLLSFFTGLKLKEKDVDENK